jgi:outer membrane protein assembly factor BamC
VIMVSSKIEFLMSLFRMSTLVLIISTLAACGVIRDRSNDYIHAERAEHVKIPEWYKSSSIEARYPIPPIDNKRSLPSEYVLPGPPDATIIILAENYVIESLEDQTWLLVNETPGRIWPSLDHFWEENGIDVEFENPRLGLMQTELVGLNLLSNQLLERLDVVGADASSPLVLQAKLGQGMKRNTTELQVRVLETKSGEQEFEGWSAMPGNPEAESKLLEVISSYLENSQSYRSYSLLAHDIGGVSKVGLVSGHDVAPYLKLDLSFARTWSSVSKALRGADINVADIDRSEGVFYLDYGHEEESTNWFWGLFSSEEVRPEYNFIIKLEKEGGGYLLKVSKAQGDITLVERMEILNLLLDNIS